MANAMVELGRKLARNHEVLSLDCRVIEAVFDDDRQECSETLI